MTTACFCEDCGHGIHDNSPDISRLEAKIDAMRDEMEQTKSLISKIQEQVQPTLDSLLNSSMFKMVFGKVK